MGRTIVKQYTCDFCGTLKPDGPIEGSGWLVTTKGLYICIECVDRLYRSATPQRAVSDMCRVIDARLPKEDEEDDQMAAQKAVSDTSLDGVVYDASLDLLRRAKSPCKDAEHDLQLSGEAYMRETMQGELPKELKSEEGTPGVKRIKLTESISVSIAEGAEYGVIECNEWGYLVDLGNGAKVWISKKYCAPLWSQG